MDWVSALRDLSFSDLGQVLDDFEKDFQKLRDEIRDLKDKLRERAELLENFTAKTPESICKGPRP